MALFALAIVVVISLIAPKFAYNLFAEGEVLRGIGVSLGLLIIYVIEAIIGYDFYKCVIKDDWS